MEGQRFDRWTQQLGQALSRRRFSGLLSVLGLGAMLARAPEAAARKHKKKGKGKKGKGKNKKKHKKTCKQGAVKCGQACVNLDNNAQHCGGCGQRCNGGNACVGGTCQDGGCPGDQRLCDGVCVDPNDDEQHCGACNNACQGDLTCLGGSCACAEGTDCGNDCVDTNTDDDHCGNCGTACGQGQTCQGGQCTSGPSGCGSGGDCLVFATSTLYTGNLGGLAGADQKCNDRAQAAGLPGAYKAWLADSTGSPSSRFVHSTGQYLLVGGLKIADDWADLTNDEPNHRLDHEINRDEFGGEITTDDMWRFTWTNIKPDGTLQDEDRHCQNWSTNEGTPNIGNAGNVNATDSFWTFASSIFCNNPGLRLYCFQQS